MIEEFAKWLQATPLAVHIAQSAWIFPTVETVHVMALTLVVGSIGMIDLRLLSVSSRNRSVIEMTNEILPWTWASFAVAVMTGSMLFMSAAVKYIGILAFQMKMVLLLLAGINMMYFHFFTYSTAHEWHLSPKTPLAARLAGALSLLFWISVVAFGRWIGFAGS